MFRNAISAVLLMLINLVLRYLADYLSPDALKRLADTALDLVEDLVKRTDTQLDDAIVLAVCQAIRAAFQIPEYESRVMAVRTKAAA